MTFTVTVGKHKCREGEAQVFAVEDGIAWGRARITGSAAWMSVAWLLEGKPYRKMVGDWADIIPPAPVKKWVWIMKTVDFKGYVRLQETGSYYATADEAERAFMSPHSISDPHWKAIARIDGSEIEE